MSSRHLGPVLVRDGEVKPLLRKHLGMTTHSGVEREAFVQSLVYDHPHVVPMNEIEPAFRNMRSVCRELPLQAGYLDNLWITPSGGIVLGECKLFRNPQARREVVAQALDYAQALQALSYEEFEASIRRARSEPDFSLWAFASGADTIEEETGTESEFIDGVTRRLREGRMMVLVIGDGIHEGVEDLVDFLQLHAGIHANIALVDLSIWEVDDGAMLIVPRLPMKTATIIRGVVQIADGAVSARVIAPDLKPDKRSISRASTGSESEYFAELESRDPASASVVRSLVDDLSEVGAVPRFTPQYVVFDIPINGKLGCLFNVKVDGDIWEGNLAIHAAEEAGVDARPFIEEMASLLGCKANFGEKKAYHYFRTTTGRRVRASNLAGKVSQVSDLVRRFIAEVNVGAASRN